MVNIRVINHQKLQLVNHHRIHLSIHIFIILYIDLNLDRMKCINLVNFSILNNRVSITDRHYYLFHNILKCNHKRFQLKSYFDQRNNQYKCSSFHYTLNMLMNKLNIFNFCYHQNMNRNKDRNFQ